MVKKLKYTEEKLTPKEILDIAWQIDDCSPETGNLYYAMFGIAKAKAKVTMKTLLKVSEECFASEEFKSAAEYYFHEEIQKGRKKVRGFCLDVRFSKKESEAIKDLDLEAYVSAKNLKKITSTIEDGCLSLSINSYELGRLYDKLEKLCTKNKAMKVKELFELAYKLNCEADMLHALIKLNKTR